MMQRSDQFASEQFASMATSPSPYDPSSAFPANAGDYDLNDLGLMKKTSSSQAFGTQGSHHQHGLSSGGKVSDIVAGKKARFVSDSNIPTVLGMGFGAPPSVPATTQSYGHAQSPPQQQQQQQQYPYYYHHHQQSLQHLPHHTHQPTHRDGFESVVGNGAPNAVSAHNAHSATSVASTLGCDRSLFSTFGLNNSNINSPSGAANSTTPSSPFAHSPTPFPGPLNLPSSAVNFASAMPNGPHSANLFLLSASNSPMFGAGFSPAGGFMASAEIPGVTMLSHNVAGNQTGRTVYVGNLPAEASVDELLNHVKFGPIENVRVLPEKNCAFISFMDGGTAASFHADASVKKLSLHGQELKIGWGRPSAVPAPILMAVQQNQATRNVYVQLGQDDKITEESLRDDLSRFGPIDQVKIVRDKNIGFVHFLSISTAMKVVSQLPQEPNWASKRVNYGKDRCAYVPKSQQQNQAHNSQAAAMSMAAAASLGYPTAFAFAGLPASAPASAAGFPRSAGDDLSSPRPTAASLEQLGNRTVYLGNIHPETTTEEICNHIRGGILQTIRYIPEKHIAFVTFVDANSALAFNHLASFSGIMIHNRRLKIGWGKPSGPLSPAIAMAVQTGCSRNVYIGNIEDPEFLTEGKLRQDFGEHGEVELVNSLREKNCAFVNFCNIQNAIKAIEAMKSHPDYQMVKISHGKDRCGRSMQFHLGSGGGSVGHRKPSGSLSPNPAAASQPRSNQGPDADGSHQEAVGGGDEALSRPMSAQDMPPIDSTSTVGGLSPLPALPPA